MSKGGTIEETQSCLEQIKQLGISHVVSLCTPGVEGRLIAREAETFWKDTQNNLTHIRLHHTPVPTNTAFADGADPYKIGFKIALKEIKDILHKEHDSKILVHCVAAIDRSPFLIASYLCCQLGFKTLSDAYAEIKKSRLFIIEHPEWIWWATN